MNLSTFTPTQNRAFNFSAGPAALPEAVLQRAAYEMLNWRGSGMGVMEMSHRGAEFMSIAAKARADLRTLLAVPDTHEVLFMQGGGLGQNAIVPLNLMAQGGSADFVITGGWSKKSAVEAQKYGAVNIAASNETAIENQAAGSYIPAFNSWQLNDKASYVHICTNETIGGIEFFNLPDTGKVPLVADVSSHILSRPMDVSKYGVMFGGAQKNIGPAGLTLVIIRKDLLGRAQAVCPSAFDFATVAKNESMYNTPPTYGIYIAGLVFEWLLEQGGVIEMEKRNIAKAQLLYRAIDNSSLFYNPIEVGSRSRMNVPFFMRDESLYQAFLDGAKARQLLQLKGHKSVGGLRASIYNAMPIEGVQALVDYMQAFEKAA